MTYSPFAVAQGISNNISAGIKQGKDENIIENILSEASASEDPRVLQNAIGKILSKVSPERQPGAIKYLENVYENIQEKQKLSRDEVTKRQSREDQIAAGVAPGVAPAVQSQLLKDKAKAGRLAQYGLGQQQSQYNLPNAENGTPKSLQGRDAQPVQPTQQSELSSLEELTDSQLRQLTGHPDREISEPAKSILKKREDTLKEDRADVRELRKETLPLKQAIIEEANLAREGIRNKTHLIGLIDRGDLDDPTFAIFAQSLPFNLGKRMLSNDTVEYKGGLVDEFGDLKNIFKGATRVKEVELYEEKLADLYLTDSQKKAILKSRINASKIKLIREEAAQEVDEKYPNITALQFNKKVEELSKAKSDALFNVVWDEQKSVLDQAENLKKIPLDYEDPEGRVILEQIMKEAGGDRNKARQIAKKKGYTVGK